MPTIRPYMAFKFCTSPDVPPHRRRAIHAAVKAWIEHIDPDRVARDHWNDLPPLDTDSSSGFSEETIRRMMTEQLEVLVVGGPYALGEPLEWCCVVRDGYIHCYYCAGLQGPGGNRVLVLPGTGDIVLAILLGWSRRLDERPHPTHPGDCR